MPTTPPVEDTKPIKGSDNSVLLGGNLEKSIVFNEKILLGDW